MELNDKIKNLYICGDIHGEFKELVFYLYSHEIKNSVIIIAGDCGIGFDKPGYYDNLYSRISGKLDNLGDIILGVRGNHDNPGYFKPGMTLDYPRLKTLEDYKEYTILGKKILCIGGAISTDKNLRIEKNQKLIGYGSSRRVWWENEDIEKLSDQEIEKLPPHLDIIISHEAPEQIGPVHIRPDYLSLDEFIKIKEDRAYLGKILKSSKPRRWFFGHHHESFSGSFMETKYNGLDINELILVRDEVL